MDVGQVSLSGEYQRSCWLRLRRDPLEQLRAHALVGAPMVFSAGDGVYELALHPARSRHPLGFTWRQHRGFPLPPVEGTLTATRLGPFVNLLLRARYRVADDAASRLLHEAVGEVMAQRTMTYVFKAISLILAEKPPADPDEALVVFPAREEDR